MPECIHGLTPSTCADCLCLDRPGEKAYGFYTFPAAYDGKCDACGDPIREGDPIVGVTEDGDRAGWVHAEHREGM